jgi:hypothetical protein
LFFDDLRNRYDLIYNANQGLNILTVGNKEKISRCARNDMIIPLMGGLEGGMPPSKPPINNIDYLSFRPKGGIFLFIDKIIQPLIRIYSK